MTDARTLILVIDDDPFARAFAEVVLSAAGYRVAQAATAAQGLALVADAAPRLIDLDYAMPGLTGLDLLVTLRGGDVNPEMAVIHSAWNSDEARRACEALGAVWLDKPLSPDGLSSAVRTALIPSPH